MTAVRALLTGLELAPPVSDDLLKIWVDVTCACENLTNFKTKTMIVFLQTMWRFSNVCKVLVITQMAVMSVTGTGIVGGTLRFI